MSLNRFNLLNKIVKNKKKLKLITNEYWNNQFNIFFKWNENFYSHG